MADAELHVIRTFLNVFEAEVAQSVLESAGIESMIRADDCRGTGPHLWMGGIELVVRREDSAQAEEVLAGLPEPAAADAAIE